MRYLEAPAYLGRNPSVHHEGTPGAAARAFRVLDGAVSWTAVAIGAVLAVLALPEAVAGSSSEVARQATLIALGLGLLGGLNLALGRLWTRGGLHTWHRCLIMPVKAAAFATLLTVEAVMAVLVGMVTLSIWSFARTGWH